MLRFKQWLEDYDSDAARDRAAQYFSIGHGDYSDEHGLDPAYRVWTKVGDTIRTSPLYRGDEGWTHGSLWGHNITDRDYKGRYEPETGRLSVVIPTDQSNLIPYDDLIAMLRRKFKNIRQVFKF